MLFGKALQNFLVQLFETFAIIKVEIAVVPHREIYALSDPFKFFRSEQLILIDKSGPGREIFLCRSIIFKIFALTNRFSVIGSVPGHKLKTVFLIVFRG
mgnify:FL=1